MFFKNISHPAFDEAEFPPQAVKLKIIIPIKITDINLFIWNPQTFNNGALTDNHSNKNSLLTRNSKIATL
jgi:hypothetical protein